MSNSSPFSPISGEISKILSPFLKKSFHNISSSRLSRSCRKETSAVHCQFVSHIIIEEFYEQLLINVFALLSVFLMKCKTKKEEKKVPLV